MTRAPLPEPTPFSEGFWAAARRDRLVVQRCRSCGRLQHYPQPRCAHCHGADREWTRIIGRGVIYSYTVTHQAFHPDWVGRVPYVVATIELEEGVRMISDLDESPEAVTIGAPVEVFFQPVAEHVTLPRFRLLNPPPSKELPMNTSGLTDLEYREENGVAWVTLNRPDTHNALSEKMRNEFRYVWQSLRDDDAVRCVVLTGAGPESFCTGIDRSELSFEDMGPFDPFSYDDLGAEIGPKTNGLWKPVIAAVNGMACGGAFYLLGEVEFVIAAEHATFFDPHVSYGMPAVYEPVFLSGRMAFGDLMRMSLLGLSERMSAATAREAGLVSQVVPADELTETARWAAEAIASAPTVPVQTTVRSLWAARKLGVQGATDMGNVLLASGLDREHLNTGQAKFRTQVRPQTRVR